MVKRIMSAVMGVTLFGVGVALLLSEDGDRTKEETR